MLPLVVSRQRQHLALELAAAALVRHIQHLLALGEHADEVAALLEVQLPRGEGLLLLRHGCLPPQARNPHTQASIKNSLLPQTRHAPPRSPSAGAASAHWRRSSAAQTCSPRRQTRAVLNPIADSQPVGALKDALQFAKLATGPVFRIASLGLLQATLQRCGLIFRAHQPDHSGRVAKMCLLMTGLQVWVCQQGCDRCTKAAIIVQRCAPLASSHHACP